MILRRLVKGRGNRRCNGAAFTTFYWALTPKWCLVETHSYSWTAFSLREREGENHHLF